MVCSSGAGIRDPDFRGLKCLRTRTGLLELILVSSFLTPEGKLTGSRSIQNRPEIIELNHIVQVQDTLTLRVGDQEWKAPASHSVAFNGNQLSQKQFSDKIDLDIVITDRCSIIGVLSWPYTWLSICNSLLSHSPYFPIPSLFPQFLLFFVSHLTLQFLHYFQLCFIIIYALFFLQVILILFSLLIRFSKNTE